MGHGSCGSWVKLSDPSSTLVHWRFLFSILQAIIETSQFAYNDGNTKSAACASPCRPEVTSQTNFSTQIYITIRGHFMLSVAKVVELLALENGAKNQNGGAGVPKLSFSIIISSSRY